VPARSYRAGILLLVRAGMCAEHYRAIEAGRQFGEALHALNEMQKWIAAEVEGPDETPIQRHAFDMRERAEELWPLVVEDKALELIAGRGPDEEPLTLHDAKYIAALMLRSDYLIEACIILECLAEEALGGRSRWPIIAALKSVQPGVSEELSIHLRELGLK
jgi:hypothetical protein